MIRGGFCVRIVAATRLRLALGGDKSGLEEIPDGVMKIHMSSGKCH